MWIILRRNGFDYLKNSQIACYKHIVSTERPLIERILWLIIAASLIGMTIWLVVSSYLAVLEAPTLTSENPNRLPVTEIDFPAIAICSENRISRIALDEYSNFIFRSTINNSNHLGRSVSEIASKLLMLGNVYDVDVSDEDFYALDRLHNVLLEVYGGPYPLADILASFTPKCDDLIQRCKWLGQTVDCKTIFGTRRTFTGMCCVFNYVRPLPDALIQQTFQQRIKEIEEPAHILKHGSNFGLMVVLDQMRNDYAYTLRSNIGSRVLLYNTYNFPDHISGAINQKFLGIGEEMFFTISPLPVYGADAMRQYSADSRDCVFIDEIKLLTNQFYSLNECLLTCRLIDIGKFCGCILPHYVKIIPDLNMCLLDDMPCLSRWKMGWFNLEPIASNFRRLNEESPDLHCPHCVPTCSYVKYSIESSTSNFDADIFARHHLDHSFTDGLNASNHSIIYINFATSTALAMEQTTLYSWYELVANFGAIASLTLGASIISIVEWFYYWSGKFGSGVAMRNENATIELLAYPEDFKTGRTATRSF